MAHPKLTTLALTTLFFGFYISGCAQIDVHGHKVEPESMALIQKGKTTKEEVAEILGTPASVSTFQDNKWYYISEKTERSVSFMKPTVIDSQTIIIAFDEKGRVTDVREKGLGDKQTVAHVSRTTPTSGRSFGFMEQLLGNVGRLGKPDQDELGQ